MPDAIDNLAQDLSQVGVNPYEYPILTDEGYVNTIPNPNFVEPYAYPNPPRFGLPEQPSGMFDPVLDYGSRQWLDRRIRSPNPVPQDLSNPSTFKTGEGIDFDARDQPVERINEGSTDEKDAFVRTGIGTTLDPKTEDIYGVKGLVPPDQAGGFVGVEYLTPKQIEDLTAGQTPSVPQGVVTPGKTVSIPGRGLPNYRQITNDDGSISYLNEDTRKIDFTVPGVKGYRGVADLTGSPNLSVPESFNFGTNTELNASQKTPTSVGAYQPVGADERTTASEGGFDNTGGDVTAGPDNRAAGPGDTATVVPGIKPGDQPTDSGNEFYDSPYRTVTPEGIAEYKLQQQGWKIDENGNYLIWVPFDKKMQETYRKFGDWRLAEDPRTTTGGETETPPGTTTPPGGGQPKPPKPGDEGTTTTTPPGGGTKPPGGGTKPPGGGGQPGEQPGRGPSTITPREPVTPLVRRETVIPTKGTKEVPLPDRQADPFAKLYADLLANSQQQEDRYRYINYDPDQIMNAAMSGFRRRGAMRSLQG